MIYLIEQLFWLLLIAFIVGAIVGWVTNEPAKSK